MAATAAKLRRVGVASGVTVLGLVLSVAFAIPAVFAGFGGSVVAALAALLVLSELGFAAAALAFVWLSGRGRAYLDVAVPTALDLGWAVGGAVALLAARTAGVAAARALDIPVAADTLTDVADADLLAVLALLVPISILVIGPCEELLFRNVVQKYLDESFSTPSAIAVASALFALVHLPTYVVASTDPAALATTLGIVFVVSLGLGWLYARTRSLVVAALAHGLYDAAIFAAAYFSLVGQRLV